MTETAIVICVALCMFLEGELVEHTYKSSMAECLKAKRTAERSIQPERVQFKCLRVIEHGYTSDSYDAESKY